MGVSGDDFEKGEADGTQDALAFGERVSRSWSALARYELSVPHCSRLFIMRNIAGRPFQESPNQQTARMRKAMLSQVV